MDISSLPPDASRRIVSESLICSDSNNNIYVISNSNIYKIDQSQKVTLFRNDLNNPKSLSVDSCGNIYVIDTGKVIQIYLENNTNPSPIQYAFPKGSTGPIGKKGGLDITVSNSQPSSNNRTPGKIIINNGNMYVCANNNNWYKLSNLTKFM